MSLKIRGQNHSNCDKSLYIPVYSEQNCMTIVKKQTSSDISTLVSGVVSLWPLSTAAAMSISQVFDNVTIFAQFL